jgi:hypothetical protein
MTKTPKSKLHKIGWQKNGWQNLPRKRKKRAKKLLNKVIAKNYLKSEIEQLIN